MPGPRVGRATSGKAPPPRLSRRSKRTADAREGGGGGGRSIAATDYLTLRDKLFHAYYAKHSYLVTTCDDHMLTGATASFFSSSFFLYFFFTFITNFSQALVILTFVWLHSRHCSFLSTCFSYLAQFKHKLSRLSTVWGHEIKEITT